MNKEKIRKLFNKCYNEGFASLTEEESKYLNKIDKFPPKTKEQLLYWLGKIGERFEIYNTQESDGSFS